MQRAREIGAREETIVASYVHDKAILQTRLRRIEGQVRGLQKMIDDEKYCVDVLTQVSSVVAALQKVGMLILEDHIRGCVRGAICEGAEGDKAVDELVDVVGRFVKAGPVSSPVSARGPVGEPQG
jgi:CsoR family transcriptional regulator, copper-sensing transcriptional repressor